MSLNVWLLLLKILEEVFLQSKSTEGSKNNKRIFRVPLYGLDSTYILCRTLLWV